MMDDWDGRDDCTLSEREEDDWDDERIAEREEKRMTGMMRG
jgi:hypothetical protein